MCSSYNDTITARATPAGRGGIGIVRVSGPKTIDIAKELIGFLPETRYASFCNFLTAEGNVIDQGLALFFKGPHSFTGEDVLELHGHGGMVVIDLLLQRIQSLGARLAEPGEFSLRAFLNDKIDLAQAEAIADLIEASSHEAARSAVQSLQGQFSSEINQLVTEITHLRMYVEAAIDFPEEEIDFLSDGKVLQQLKLLSSRLNTIFGKAKEGRALNEGMKIVIVGYPNAGKSSLLNCLSGNESAIVSEVPGTTRDIVRESIIIDGMPLLILDTAGLRFANDEIEREGVKRAWKEIPQADRILLIIDAKETPPIALSQHPLLKQFSSHMERVTVVRNKIDLTLEDSRVDFISESSATIINLSAKTGQGLSLLTEHLKQCMGYQGSENVFTARRRHLEALLQANYHFEQALEQLIVYKAGELVAEELKQAQNALSEITGKFRSDDLLGKIFSSFCIGK